MATEYCGIRIRQQSPHFEGANLYVGHQWIEFLDQAGNVTSSSGFWPSGNLFWGGGEVKTNDPYHGDTSSSTYTVEVFPTPGGTDEIEDCKEATCDEIQDCVRFRIEVTTDSPRIYSLLLYNCRHWVTNVIEQCCLTVET